jgi:hypothetical protein
MEPPSSSDPAPLRPPRDGVGALASVREAPAPADAAAVDAFVELADLEGGADLVTVRVSHARWKIPKCLAARRNRDARGILRKRLNTASSYVIAFA